MLCMAGTRDIFLHMDVRYTSDHLCRRLLEDLRCRTASGKGRCGSSTKLHDNIQWASRWTQQRNSNRRDVKRGNVEEWEPKRWSGRERSGDGWSKKTWPWESTRVSVSVQGTNQRCENHGLHHCLLYRLLDADVFRRNVSKTVGKAESIFFDNYLCLACQTFLMKKRCYMAFPCPFSNNVISIILVITIFVGVHGYHQVLDHATRFLYSLPSFCEADPLPKFSWIMLAIKSSV